MGFIKFRFEQDEPEEFEKVVVFGGEKKPKVKKEKKAKPGKQFILDWEDELGYAGNPFKEEILKPIHAYISGYKKERDKINLFVIHGHKLGIIHSTFGYGRTMLLQWLEEQLSHHSSKVVVLSLLGKDLLQDKELLKRLQKKTFSSIDIVKKHHESMDKAKNLEIMQKRLHGKKLIILGDTVTSICKDNLEFLNLLLSGVSVQLILTTNEDSKQDLDKLFKIPDKLNIRLQGLDFPETKKMLRKRIDAYGGEGIEPFTDSKLKTIWEKAHRNPRQILKLCEQKAIEICVKQQKRLQEKKAKPKDEHHEDEITAPDVGLESKEEGKGYEIKVVDHGGESVTLKHDAQKKTDDYKIKSK